MDQEGALDNEPRPDRVPRRESAVIHLFPPGGRAALHNKALDRKDNVVPIPSGRGWYHDVAIRDAGNAKETKPRT